MGDATAATHVLTGTVLVGKYRVDRILGQGGMGVVVAAHHLQLDEKVAIKFLLPEALADAHADARFLREAQAAVKIKSDHVARVTDVGRLENGLPYMVMEYLDGRDLSAWLAEYGPMTVDRAVDFLLQACEAVAEAHSLGIVHRDLKPANLFCIQRRDGALAIKVLDFGISKVTTPGASGHDVTRTATIIGSPTYMSPEQLRASKEVDARADIWSLGVILYELLTARTPFESESLPDLAIKIATEPATPLRALRGDVPPQLEVVIARCLEKDRGRRFASVGELASALEAFGTRSAATSVERIRGTQRVTSPSFPQLATTMTAVEAREPREPPTLATWGKTGGLVPPRRSSTALVGIVVAFVAVLLASAAMVFVRVTRRPLDVAGAGSATSSAPAAAAPIVDTLPPAASAPLVETALPVASAPAPVATTNGGHRPVTAPHVRAGCNPPFTLDELGRKHFKPQCFGDR